MALLSVLIAHAGQAVAADACTKVLADLSCPPVVQGPRLNVLRDLDQRARAHAGREEFAKASAAFSCLLKLDLTPETAMNLSVVAEAAGDLSQALLAATCGEDISVGEAREHASAERRRLQALVPATSGLNVPNTAQSEASKTPPVFAQDPPASPNASASTAIGKDVQTSFPERADRRLSTWQRSAIVAGAVALVAGGALFVAAHVRANDFQEHQRTHGYDDQARSLRSQAATLQTASGLTAGLGALTLGLVVLTF